MHSDWKVVVELSLFTDSMILEGENPKKSTKHVRNNTSTEVANTMLALKVMLHFYILWTLKIN